MRAVIGLLLLALGTAPSFAASQDAAFTVKGIAVDVAGEAAGAKQEAIKRARAQGFALLMNKLVIRSELSKLPQPTADDLRRMVRGMDVEDEKVAPKRFRARYGLRFSRPAVKAWLSKANVAWSEMQAQRTFVLPVLEAGATKLWEKDNVWANGWDTAVVSNLLSNFEVPAAGLADRPALATVKSKGAKGLADWAKSKDAGAVMIARARLSGSKLSMSAEWSDGHVDKAEPLTARQGESQSALLTRGVLTLALRLDDAWKDKTKITPGVATTLSVRIPAADAADWGEVQRRLSKIALVEEVKVRSINPPYLAVDIVHIGERPPLEVAAKAAGLKFETVNGETVLRRSDRHYDAIPEEEAGQ